MKRVIASILVVMMMFSFGACSSGTSENSKEVEAYVAEHKTELLSSMETSFASSSGMTCTSSIEVKGAGFIISVNINELDNLDDSIKEQMQSAYDSMQSAFDGMLEEMQQELPELEYFEIIVCEKDGDEISTIRSE